jgi:hypothetical protein
MSVDPGVRYSVVAVKARTRGIQRAIGVGIAAAQLACSAGVDPPTSSPRYSGMLGQVTGVRVWTNLLLADVGVDGAGPNLAVVDTGSPIDLLSADSFPGATLPPGSGTVSSLSFAGLTFEDAPVVGATGPVVASDDTTVPIAGVVGCALLCPFAVSLDYRDAQLVLGPAAVPAGVEGKGESTTFTLQGGGTGSGTGSFPASRILLGATVEGTAYTLLLDTGSSDVGLRQSAFDAIASDGRAQLPLTEESTQGTSHPSALRVRSMTAGGASLSGVIVAAGPATDSLLDGIAQEIGHPIDGMIGGSFLRAFFVTIDYPDRSLRLRRYLTGAPTFDEADRIGVALSLVPAGAGYPVARVFSGTDAASKGVAAGDVIVAIDGQPLAALGAAEAVTALSGPVGSSKNVEFGNAASPTVSGQTLAIRVDELLPP